jgi:hypothetical protein
MRAKRQIGFLTLLAAVGFANGLACAPTPHANAVTVTYYYMPG